MTKLLILTDFSPAAQHAAAFAQALFADTAAEFCLAHAFALPPEVAYGGSFMLAEDRQAAEQSLLDLRRTLTQQPVPAYHTYRTVVGLGGPEAVVEQLLQQERFDLIVVGATGSGNAEVFGSVATGLIRATTAPVLVVPAQCLIRPLTRIVLATDYRSLNDAVSLTLLAELASRKAAQVTLLTIEPAPPVASQEHPRRTYSLPVSPLMIDYVEQVFDSVQTDTYTLHDDDVKRGIDTYLDLHRVDLLALLPHHKSWFDVLAGSSVTRSLAYHPHVPLLALYDTSTTPSEESAPPFLSYLT